MIEFGNAVPYDIHITGSANKGFIVKVGCCKCVFTDKKAMIAALEHYINDPDKMETLYNESAKSLRPQAVEGSGMASGRTMRGPAVSARNQEECQVDDCGPDQAR